MRALEKYPLRRRAARPPITSLTATVPPIGYRLIQRLPFSANVAAAPSRCYPIHMSEYPKGRTALGDLIAAELDKDPDNPLNRAKRAAEEARLREAPSDYPKGRTALGDMIAAELAQNPNSPRNRAKRAGSSGQTTA